MKKLILFLSFLGMFYAHDAQAQRTAVHWYLPKMSLKEAGQLKGYDLVIVDPEIIFNDRASLDALRADNPNIQIYCYFNIVEWFNPMFSDKPWSKNILAFLEKNEEWFLHGQDGKRLSFWPGMQTMNCLADCPKLRVYTEDKKPVNYVEFITDRFIEDILKEYRFDGVLMDNLWNKVYWLGNYGSNKNGFAWAPVKDADVHLVDVYWRKGLIDCLDTLKKFGGESLKIIGNPGHLDYQKQCSGKMFENFPEIYLNEADSTFEAWYENISNASSFPDGPDIFNARTDNYFFTICSSMLLDNVYFSYLQNTKYENKYQLALGAPIAETRANSDGSHSRAYQNGLVFVDPLAKKAWIFYNDGTTRRE